MITKITNTPIYNSAINLQYQKDYKLQNTPTTTQIPGDSVTFTSKQSKTQELVDMAFNKLAQTRLGKNLGNYIDKLGNTNIHLRETEFGKKAQLTIIRNQEFANFELSRSASKPAKISVTDKEVSSEKLLTTVSRYLESLK